MTSHAVVEVAKLFRFVREAPPGSNRGRWVEALQRVGNAVQGKDPWCACYVTAVLDLAFAGASPLPATASCDVLLEHARARGWLTSEPAAGDVFLVLRGPKDAVHTGVVTAVHGGVVRTIEGNTNDDGSREGFAVCERTRARAGSLIYVRYPRA